VPGPPTPCYAAVAESRPEHSAATEKLGPVLNKARRPIRPPKAWRAGNRHSAPLGALLFCVPDLLSLGCAGRNAKANAGATGPLAVGPTFVQLGRLVLPAILFSSCPLVCCCTASQTRDIHNKVCFIPRVHRSMFGWWALGAGRSHCAQTEPVEQHNIAKCVVPTTMSLSVSALRCTLSWNAVHNTMWVGSNQFEK